MHRFTRADAAAFSVAVLWGINLSVIKDGLGFFHPMAFNSLRVASAALAMAACALILEGPVPVRKKDIGRLVFFGILGNTVYQLLFVFGMTYTKAGNAALLVAGATIFTAIFSRLLGHELHGRTLWVGISLSLTGVLFILLESSALAFSQASLKGDLMVLGATIIWGVYTVYARSAMVRYPAVFFSAATFGSGAAVFLLLSIPSIRSQDWWNVPWRGYFDAAFSAFFGLTMAYLLFFYGVSRLGSTRASIYTNLTPFFGVLFAWLLLGEQVTAAQIAGGCLIVIGIYLTRSRRTG